MPKLVACLLMCCSPFFFGFLLSDALFRPFSSGITVGGALRHRRFLVVAQTSILASRGPLPVPVPNILTVDSSRFLIISIPLPKVPYLNLPGLLVPQHDTHDHSHTIDNIATTPLLAANRSTSAKSPDKPQLARHRRLPAVLSRRMLLVDLTPSTSRDT